MINEVAWEHSYIRSGMFLKRKLLRLIVFDRQTGSFWKGPRTPPPKSTSAKNKNVVNLSDIHALQVLEKWVKQSGPEAEGYTSFELNAVTNDGQRNNVIDHSELDDLRADGKTLADFLGIPLWDTTRE